MSLIDPYSGFVDPEYPVVTASVEAVSEECDYNHRTRCHAIGGIKWKANGRWTVMK
jgi:hypothetical protein